MITDEFLKILIYFSFDGDFNRKYAGANALHVLFNVFSASNFDDFKEHTTKKQFFSVQCSRLIT